MAIFFAGCRATAFQGWGWGRKSPVRIIAIMPSRAKRATDLVISVRVLTPLEPLADPLLIDIGTEGLYVIGDRDSQEIRGCFLPEVAVEQGWDPTELVSHCCADKMDLPRDSWKPPTDLKFFKFRAIGVSE